MIAKSSGSIRQYSLPPSSKSLDASPDVSGERVSQLDSSGDALMNSPREIVRLISRGHLNRYALLVLKSLQKLNT